MPIPQRACFVKVGKTDIGPPDVINSHQLFMDRLISPALEI
jgi:hypothetical protein